MVEDDKVERDFELVPKKGDEFIVIVVLFLASLALRLAIVLPTGFDGLYGQDSYAYYDFAGQLQTYVRTGQPPGPFLWPVGYPLALAVGFSLIGVHAATGQALSLVLGALLTPLVFILARQVGSGRFGALAAASLMTVCGQALQSSMVLMADIPALALGTMSAVFLWHYRYTKRRRWLALAAFALTLAGMCRWLYFVLAIPWTLATIAAWWPLRPRKQIPDALAAGLAALVAFTPQLLYNQFSPMSPLDHAWVQNWSPANMWQRTFDNPDGHFEYERVNALYYAQPVYEPYYLSPVFIPFVLAGAWMLTRHRQYAAAFMLGGWILLPYIFLTGIPYQNIRFPLIVFPAVAVVAGKGLEVAAQGIGRWRLFGEIAQRRLASGIAVGVLIVGIGHTLSVSLNIIDTFIYRQQADKAIVAWAAERIPSGARVYTFGLTLTFQHYTSLAVYELFYETPRLLEQRWNKGIDDYLVLNVSNIENQWKGLAPQVAYHWLRDARGLVDLGQQGNYTLFRVKG